MELYRIARKEFIEDIEGTGARLFGGRWNYKGTPMLYCAENRSLAILEVMVHFDKFTIPEELYMLTLKIPNDSVLDFDQNKFVSIYQSDDQELAFKQAGEEWVQSSNSLALKVPSVITLGEFNVIINPMHKVFSKVVKKKTEKLILDPRLIVF